MLQINSHCQAGSLFNLLQIGTAASYINSRRLDKTYQTKQSFLHENTFIFTQRLKLSCIVLLMINKCWCIVFHWKFLKSKPLIEKLHQSKNKTKQKQTISVNSFWQILHFFSVDVNPEFSTMHYPTLQMFVPYCDADGFQKPPGETMKFLWTITKCAHRQQFNYNWNYKIKEKTIMLLYKIWYWMQTFEKAVAWMFWSITSLLK